MKEEAHVIYEGVHFFKDGQPFGIIRFNELIQERVRYHTHDFIEVCYVASGCGYHRTDEGVQPVARGDLFIIDRGVYHSFYRDTDVNELITFNLLFQPEFLDGSLTGAGCFDALSSSYLFNPFWDKPLDGMRLRLPHHEKNGFETLLNLIYQEYNGQRAGFGSMIRGYMIQLIVTVLRSFETHPAEHGYSRKAEALQDVMLYLQSHYMKPVQLGELAAMTFFNKNYFCKVFKETAGVTVTDYVHRLRIEQACRLLEISDKKMVEIAADVGFSDYKSFYTVFTRIVGIPPRDYQRKISQREAVGEARGRGSYRN